MTLQRGTLTIVSIRHQRSAVRETRACAAARPFGQVWRPWRCAAGGVRECNLAARVGGARPEACMGRVGRAVDTNKSTHNHKVSDNEHE